MSDPRPNEILHRLHVTENGHASFLFKHVATEGFGVLEVEICEECHFIYAACTHQKNTWSEDGSTLTCDFCGIDGT